MQVLWRTWTCDGRQISLFLKLVKVLKNSTQRKIAHIQQTERVKIDVIKIGKDTNSFFSDVFTTAVVIVAYSV